MPLRTKRRASFTSSFFDRALGGRVGERCAQPCANKINARASRCEGGLSLTTKKVRAPTLPRLVMRMIRAPHARACGAFARAPAPSAFIPARVASLKSDARDACAFSFCTRRRTENPAGRCTVHLVSAHPMRHTWLSCSPGASLRFLSPQIYRNAEVRCRRPCAP